MRVDVDDSKADAISEEEEEIPYQRGMCTSRSQPSTHMTTLRQELQQFDT